MVNGTDISPLSLKGLALFRGFFPQESLSHVMLLTMTVTFQNYGQHILTVLTTFGYLPMLPPMCLHLF